MAPKQQPKWLRDLRALVFSRRGLTIFKGTLAYTIAYVLIFLEPFNRLSRYPQTLGGMMLIVSAGGPGKAIGAVISGNLLGVAGLLVGSANFYILAKLSPWPIAQAVYWFFSVYALAYVKAQGLRWFGFSLFAILMSFNGVYSSLLLGGRYDSVYLKEYLKSYLWGVAINVFVALFVFPLSSEKELRKTLILSLDHIETFGMLISRSYLMIITDEEKKLRDRLSQTIRADFGFLQQKLEETTIEINWSRWSLADYKCFIARTRALQLALISTHSSLHSLESGDDKVYKQHFLPKTITAFNRLRLDMRLTIREIAQEFGCEPLDLPSCVWNSYMDIERQGQQATQRRGRTASFLSTAKSVIEDDEIDHAEELKLVSQRLQQEVNNAGQEESESYSAPSGSRPVSTFVNTPQITRGSKPGSTVNTLTRPPKDFEKQIAECQQRGPQSLISDFTNFKQVQTDLINKVLIGGKLAGCGQDVVLKVMRPQPSIFDTYGYDHVRGHVNEEPIVREEPTLLRKRNVNQGSSSSEDVEKQELRSPRKPTVEDVDDEDEDGEAVFAAMSSSSSSSESDLPHPPMTPDTARALLSNHSVIRVYSILFALSQYVTELDQFHRRVTAPDEKGHKRKNRLHFHFFESLNKPEIPHYPSEPSSSEEEGNAEDLSLKEAICILEAKPYEKKHRNIWYKLHLVKQQLYSGDSVYAAKVAAATTIYALLIWSTQTRDWFINYSLTSGLFTVVVALAPTLGQSALTFILQIAGSSIGLLVGLALLEMFRGVGGYLFNPYGITCLAAVYSLPLQYLIYEKPKFFPLALLALNGTGVLISSQWVYREYYNLPFDTPAYRTGKSLAALAIAIALCGTFQLLVLRNPARRTLRQALAALTYSTLSYNTLLQAFVRGVIPVDGIHRASPAAVARVHRELQHREMKLQGQIISIMPLITFAAAEPSLSNKFSPAPALKLIRANQVILDRLRESRDAIGTTTFQKFLLENFVAVLSPYRRRSSRLSKTILSLCAASLASKLPLPHDIPKHEASTILQDFMHDALVLSYRFAMTEEGQKSVQNGEFTRYWFYLLGVTSIWPQLREIEDVCKEMFGKLEDSLT